MDKNVEKGKEVNIVIKIRKYAILEKKLMIIIIIIMLSEKKWS